LTPWLFESLVTIVFYFHLGSAIGILYDYVICDDVQCVRHQVIFVIMYAVII